VEKSEKLSLSISKEINHFEVRLNEVHTKIERDRELLDTKLSRLDDTDMVREWVSKQINEAESRLMGELNSKYENNKRLLNWIVDDNLVVPGLIGQKENFVNLKGYLGFTYSQIQKGNMELEQKMITQLSEN